MKVMLNILDGVTILDSIETVIDISSLKEGNE